jgi:hypothetical protein
MLTRLDPVPPGDVEAAEATCPVGMKIIGGGFSAIGDDAAMRVAIGDEPRSLPSSVGADPRDEERRPAR